MANPTCTTATINATQYGRLAINPIQQKALLIYAKVLELAAIGGTDYILELTGDLLTDTVAPPNTTDGIRAGNVAIAFANAASAGASVPTTLSDKLAVCKGLLHVPGGCDRLDQIDMYLNCQLGRGKTYPQ